MAVGETGLVDGHALLGRHLPGQLDREAVGVVQAERQVAADDLGARRQRLLQQGQAGAQHGPETLLLAGHHTGDEILVLVQLGVGVAHHLDGGVHQRGRHQVVDAELEGLAHGAADQAAQHVSAVFIAGKNAVVDKERDRAGMVGEDAQGDVDLSVGTVAPLGDGLGGRDDGPHHVGVPHRSARPAGSTRGVPGRRRCRCCPWAAASGSRRPGGRTA